MPILQSCCCWKSVRQGSIACGVYTGIYYVINAVHSSYMLYEELSFSKNTSRFSLIDRPLSNGTYSVFSSLIFAFSSCGVLSSILLLYGIFKDIKYLLIPWILNMAFFTLMDIIYVIHGFVVRALHWNPAVALVITIDFFLDSLNLYAILCVISQYQAYTKGRGRASDSNDAISRSSATNSKFKKPPVYYDRSPTVLLPPPLTTGSNHLQAPPVKPNKSVKFGDCVEIEVMVPLWDTVLVGGLT